MEIWFHVAECVDLNGTSCKIDYCVAYLIILTLCLEFLILIEVKCWGFKLGSSFRANLMIYACLATGWGAGLKVDV